ncbi:formimidoylglutamate deiminase [Sphaerisporangium album]|uniref:Formimidoylglutamate deiminase n=1 Tax=Sphaerisporangium album TaxID=509200 RepID=A0A367F0U7_9ACTN|nr:formimidoylglutamate deiminase [Sphaerisporangium album]RCG23953.1 formimidoylglutamate deiminase [Sphaerisporangium album]
MPVSLYYADLAWLGTGAPAVRPGEDDVTARPGDEIARRGDESARPGWDRVVSGVVIEVADGRITAVRTGVPAPPPGAVHLRGLTLPGLANAHSHAFHRALRGRTQRERGTFWTWRRQMYEVAGRLTPENHHALARAAYAEMALAGVTCVGEFHYLHHDAGGRPYQAANAMGEALIAAAADAGIRITLLDTCYLRGGFAAPLEGPQLRFGDGDAHAWAERADALKGGGQARIGAAIHSVRAVPAGELAVVSGWARERGAPLHFHLSEQVAENEACLAAHGRTPAELLDAHGVLGRNATAVHATHLTPGDVTLLGGSGTGVCMCPTTERDLADGVGPARRLFEAGSPLSLGSDSNAVVDLFEEARGVELDERLATRERGHWRAAELLRGATSGGHAALGWPDAGRIEAGAPADLVAVALDSVRTAGASEDAPLETVVFAATAADVREVVAGGRHIVSQGRHLLVDDVPAALAAAVSAVTSPFTLKPSTSERV